MQVELSIIKYLLNHNNFVKYSSYLKPNDFPDELRLVWTALCSVHCTVDEDGTHPVLLDVANVVFSNHPKDKEFYEKVFDNLEQYVPLEQPVVALIESIKQRRILQDLSIATYEVAEGKKDIEEVNKLIAKLQDTSNVTIEENPFVSDDLEILLNDTIKKPGLRWRLTCLNKSLGSLRDGDFGFIFARPETGKTTFLASEVSCFITQTERPIVWFNNEEQGQKVMLRVIQAYFGVTLNELYGNIQHYRSLFKEQTGGRFKLYDSAQINKNTVENLCKKYLPALVVFDQIDKLQGFKAERDDLLLGSIYGWGRELAKEYCPVIGVTQSDASGEGLRKLTMANVANAKTAKQAEADWIMGIGLDNSTGWESVRFLNLCKNKLMGDTDTDPNLRHAYLTCRIEPTIARYIDIV